VLLWIGLGGVDRQPQQGPPEAPSVSECSVPAAAKSQDSPQPWVSGPAQEKYTYKDDSKTPILPPIPPGTRSACDDPPERAAILRALPRVHRGVPGLYEVFRDNIDFALEKVVDQVDPPRFFPLVGPAQLHHCHYKCTVYFDNIIHWVFLVEFEFRCSRSAVVYLDRDHLHLCPAEFHLKGWEAEERGK
jgi:hypothetical protein